MARRKHFGAEDVYEASIPHATADMNVTPMIDVLLVLLVIFMAALIVSQNGLDINLPAETQQAQEQAPDVNQIVVNYPPNGNITINNQDVSIAQLEERLRSIFEQRREKTMLRPFHRRRATMAKPLMRCRCTAATHWGVPDVRPK